MHILLQPLLRAGTQSLMIDCSRNEYRTLRRVRDQPRRPENRSSRLRSINHPLNARGRAEARRRQARAEPFKIKIDSIEVVCHGIMRSGRAVLCARHDRVRVIGRSAGGDEHHRTARVRIVHGRDLRGRRGGRPHFGHVGRAWGEGAG